MSQKDPNEDEYGRHASFRPRPDSHSPNPPVIKWLLALFALVFVVVGYDRWRRHGVQSPMPTTVVQAPQIAAPERETEAALSVETIPEEEPPTPAVEIPQMAAPTYIVEESSPAHLSAPPHPAEVTPPPIAEPEKPDTTAVYVMELKPGSSSFVGQGYVNGKDVEVLADTGASMVIVPEKMAQRFNLKKGRAMSFKTGGGVVPHYATTIDKLTLGKIELRGIQAAINPEMQTDFILLGMNALNMMEMEVEKGKRMVLKYKQPDVAESNMRTVIEEEFKRSSRDCAGSRGNKFDRQTLDCLRGN